MDIFDFPDDNAFGSDPAQNANITETVQEPAPERDDVYYFDVIVFKVENTLFRVPKNGFDVPGSFFETMFSLPGPGENGEQLEGTDDEHPLSLVGISKAHFRGFLRVMYPFKGSAFTYDEWLGALHLGTQWDFTDIRNKSIEALSTLIQNKSASEKILLAKEYGVKQWLLDGCSQLVTQTAALDLDQLCQSRLDALTVARLLSIRESVHMLRGQNHNACYYCAQNIGAYSVTESDAQALVTQKFASDLATMA
ncbi:hypothetical protein GALMADRAFT_226127 [Galerina marginata CBS 339.88]|uniref:BTB domain-containing protein n=1 Tax=Galerina marginata (strain CBS 339.88) TaxID=685588 RepID=A0A067SX88_GALM3|nr:hypothetical protein GALMADRAFT_226127 [Galerina marginata CBS 339.88]